MSLFDHIKKVQDNNKEFNQNKPVEGDEVVATEIVSQQFN